MQAYSFWWLRPQKARSDPAYSMGVATQIGHKQIVDRLADDQGYSGHRNFDSLIGIPVGDGRRVFFLEGQMYHGESVREVVLLVLQLVNTRNRNRRTVETTLQNNSWLLDISEPLMQKAAIQCVHLWLQIDNLQRGQPTKGL